MDILQIYVKLEIMFGLKNILDNLDINILNIELHTVGKEWSYRNVNNPYSRIYYLTSGYGTIEHHGHTYPLCPGNLYLIPCYTTVNMFCPEQLCHYYIHFTGRMPTGLDILSIFSCDFQIDGNRHQITPALLDRLLELNPGRELLEYDANKPIYKKMLDRANLLDSEKSPSNLIETNALLRLILSAFFKEYHQPQINNTLHALTRFGPVFEHIHDNLSCPITNDELAEIVGLNPTYFSNLFSKLMGISPIQYINKRRVEESQKFLLTTHDTLYQIAQKVGCSDEYYFSRMFKKIVGIAPHHYRKQSILLHQR
jgi:AraC-like DNA-binding protein